jgi:hypothetical protein
MYSVIITLVLNNLERSKMAMKILGRVAYFALGAAAMFALVSFGVV